MGSFEKLLKDPAITRMFDLDEEDIDKLKVMHKEMKLNRKEMNAHRLKIDESLPKIHLHRCWVQKMIGYFDQKIYDEDKKVTYTTDMIREGYMVIPIGEIMNITFPDQEEVMYAMQTHQNTDILEKIKEKEETIRKQWEKIIIYYRVREDLERFDYLAFYRMDGIRIAETNFEKDTSVVDDQADLAMPAPLEVEWEIEFEDIEELEGYSLGVVDGDECTARMLYSANVIVYVILKLLAGEGGNIYKVTKENLNTLVKKKDNETIDLNREFKTALKKNANAKLYYIGEFEETENE